MEEESPLLCNLVFSLKPFSYLWKLLPCNRELKSFVGNLYWILDVNIIIIYLKLFSCVQCFYLRLLYACLWFDHPLVCAVRNFSIGKCIVSLELDRVGLDNCISRNRVQGFGFYYVVTIMLYKLSWVQQETSTNEV